MSQTVQHPCSYCRVETEHVFALEGGPHVIHVYTCQVCGTEHREA